MSSRVFDKNSPTDFLLSIGLKLGFQKNSVPLGRLFCLARQAFLSRSQHVGLFGSKRSISAWHMDAKLAGRLTL